MGGHVAHVDAVALEVEVLVVRDHLCEDVEYTLFRSQCRRGGGGWVLGEPETLTLSTVLS